MTLKRVQLSAHFFLGRVKTQIYELFLQNFPGNPSGPVLWLNLINGVLDTAEAYLAASSKVGMSEDEAKNLIKEANHLTHLAFNKLSFIEGATVEDIPHPIVQPMKRWFDDLNLKKTIIFRAENVANYEIRKEYDHDFKGFRNPSSTLYDALEKIDWPVNRITVPGKALGIIPHFSIVAHEVGHAVFEKIKLNISSAPQERSKLLMRLQARIPSSHFTLELHSKLNKIVISWQKEIMADAFAYFIMGPAFFFALSEVFQLLSPNYGGILFHPPNALRRELIFHKLTEGEKSFSQVFKTAGGKILTVDFNSPNLKKLPSQDDFFSDLSKQFSDPVIPAIATELVPYFESISSQLFDQTEQYIDQNCAHLRYTPEMYENDLKNHLESLISGIPPIETGVLLDEKASTELVSILNVGWVVLLTQLDKLKVKTTTKNKDAQKADVLHELLLKAIELSEARRDWEDAK